MMPENENQQAELKLFMLLPGCKHPARHTKQHDVFFGIAANLRDQPKKKNTGLKFMPGSGLPEDVVNLGYFKLSNL